MPNNVGLFIGKPNGVSVGSGRDTPLLAVFSHYSAALLFLPSPPVSVNPNSGTSVYTYSSYSSYSLRKPKLWYKSSIHTVHTVQSPYSPKSGMHLTHSFRSPNCGIYSILHTVSIDQSVVCTLHMYCTFSLDHNVKCTS